MAFMDPKETQMEIILTERGRALLSQGKLIVKYYRFMDDDVDYQPRYYVSGSTPIEIDYT